jgi:YVTN family beta-propeller protein
MTGHLGSQHGSSQVSRRQQGLYVANIDSGTVSVIDTATNAVTVTTPVGGGDPFAFGIFIQPAPKFAGISGTANCLGPSISGLAQQYGGLAATAVAFGAMAWVGRR